MTLSIESVVELGNAAKDCAHVAHVFATGLRLLFSCKAGPLLRLTDEAHGSVEWAVVAVGGVAGDGHADL